MNRALSFVVLLVALGLVRAHAGIGPQPYRGMRYLMGTWCELTIFDAPSDHAATVGSEAFSEIGRLERIFSNWDPASEVSRINASASDQWQAVSPELAEVVGHSLEMCQDSGGAFDPTVGPLLKLWRFYSDDPVVPERSAVTAARANVGCGRVRVRHDPPAIAIASGMSLDFGGIAKGYASDRAVAVLQRGGIRAAKLDLGSSSLAFLGRQSNGWHVVVRDPRTVEEPLVTFRVDEGAVSTSGQYERFVIQAGKQYGHIFDPRIGVPVDSSLRSVTVVAANGIVADALSTAAFVLGPAQGRQLIAKTPGAKALFVEERGRDLQLTVVGKLAGFRELRGQTVN